MKDPRELLKTIVTTDMTGDSKGGLMLPQQADRFIDLTLDYSKILKLIRHLKKTTATGEIDTLNVGSVVSEGASEDPALPVSGEEVKPTFGKLEYTMKKIRSVFDLSTDALLDNIEAERQLLLQKGDQPPGDFRETLMRAYSRRIGSDQELLAIQGDSSITDTSTKLNRLLKTNDGWGKLSESCPNIVDAGYTNLSLALFADLVRAIPAPHLARINELRWFMGPKAAIQWSLQVADRKTQLGDEALKGADVSPLGIPIVMVPLLPENLTATDGTVSYNNLSYIWLTFPENLVFLTRRAVESYWEFVPRRDHWENTTYTETDMLIENLNAMVRANNVKVDSAIPYS